MRFAVVSDDLSLRREMTKVSIRFEVRGGFRRGMFCPILPAGVFQSALRFAVVSDVCVLAQMGAAWIVSIRFEVRGGFRRTEFRCHSCGYAMKVSIRFEVRGGFRPNIRDEVSEALS